MGENNPKKNQAITFSSFFCAHDPRHIFSKYFSSFTFPDLFSLEKVTSCFQYCVHNLPPLLQYTLYPILPRGITSVPQSPPSVRAGGGALQTIRISPDDHCHSDFLLSSHGRKMTRHKGPGATYTAVLPPPSAPPPFLISPLRWRSVATF